MNNEMIQILREINSNLAEIKSLLCVQGERNESNVLPKLENSIVSIENMGVAVETKEQFIEEIHYDRDNSLEKLEEYLESKKIRINNMIEAPVNEELVKIASYMGEKYQMIAPLLERIKPSLCSGASVTFNIADYSQASISAMCQLSNFLYQISFLKQYEYKKSPQYLIRLLPNRMPLAINFLSGHWFEIYIHQAIKELLSIRFGQNLMNNIDFDIYRNLQIQLANGNFFELDLVVRIGDDYYWIECKTSNYQEHVYKYSEFAKRYQFPYENSFLVILDDGENRHKQLQGLFDIQVHSPVSFLEAFEAIICKRYGIANQRIE